MSLFGSISVGAWGQGQGHDGALIALLSGGWLQITAPESLEPDLAP